MRVRPTNPINPLTNAQIIYFKIKPPTNRPLNIKSVSSHSRIVCVSSGHQKNIYVCRNIFLWPFKLRDFSRYVFQPYIYVMWVLNSCQSSNMIRLVKEHEQWVVLFRLRGMEYVLYDMSNMTGMELVDIVSSNGDADML